MKIICDLPIWAVVLALAWHPVAQAQQSDAPKVEANGAVDLEGLFSKSQAGDPEAQFRLGDLYEQGEILERDLGKAIESYRQAAEQGRGASRRVVDALDRLGFFDAVTGPARPEP